MSPSCSSGVPVTRTERNPRSSSPAVSSAVWIAGPPTLRRAMIRSTVTVGSDEACASARSGGAIAPQPLDGAPESFFQTDAGLVVEQPAGLLDRRLGMEDVASAPRRVHWLAIRPDQASDHA